MITRCIHQNNIIIWLHKFEKIMVIYYYPLTTEKVERDVVYHAKNYDSMLSLIASWIIYTFYAERQALFFLDKTLQKTLLQKRRIIFAYWKLRKQKFNHVIYTSKCAIQNRNYCSAVVDTINTRYRKMNMNIFRPI